MDSILLLATQAMGWASFLLIDKRQTRFRTVVTGLWFATYFLLSFGLLVAGLAAASVATWLFVESRNMVTRWAARGKEPDRDSNSQGR